jgi:hypothetical protein
MNGAVPVMKMILGISMNPPFNSYFQFSKLTVPRRFATLVARASKPCCVAYSDGLEKNAGHLRSKFAPIQRKFV